MIDFTNENESLEITNPSLDDVAAENLDAAENPSSPSKFKSRSTSLALERDAQAILADLAAGLDPSQIRHQRGWTGTAYHRRLRIAENLFREQFDPERVYALFLRYKSTHEKLQRAAETRLASINRAIDLLGESATSADLRAIAPMTNAAVKTMRFISECQDKIVKFARELNLPDAPEKKPTLAQRLRDIDDAPDAEPGLSDKIRFNELREKDPNLFPESFPEYWRMVTSEKRRQAKAALRRETRRHKRKPRSRRSAADTPKPTPTAPQGSDAKEERSDGEGLTPGLHPVPSQHIVPQAVTPDNAAPAQPINPENASQNNAKPTSPRHPITWITTHDNPKR